MADRLAVSELTRVYQHVFLPPKVPQSSDEDTKIDEHLLTTTTQALQSIPKPLEVAISSAIVAVKNLQTVTRSSPADLCRVLNALADGQTLPVHVRSQNAGVLITCKHDDLIFESFELSPTNSAVFGSKGRLTRCFPAVAVAINTNVHPRRDLIPVIAQTLHDMSNEVVPEMQPETRKAGAQHKEHRDSASPAIMTGMFFGFLKGFGKTVSVSSISKHTREEVFWKDALAPWRRSSMWLLIKVTLHLTITRAPDGTEETYKRIMAFIMSRILDAAAMLQCPNDVLHAMSAKIVRRVHKMRATNTTDDTVLLSKIDSTLQKASQTIAGRWQAVQNSNGRTLDLKDLARLDTMCDTHIALPMVDAHLSALKSRASTSLPSQFQPTSSLLEFRSDTLPTLPGRNSTDHHYATANLQAFETWVSQNIDDWLALNAGTASESCHQLHSLIERYYWVASKHYGNNPEGISSMILTIVELWVACDKIAVAECHMLADYPHDIPLEPLQNLLLPFLHQMDRLQRLEIYLNRRSREAKADCMSRLFSTDSPRAFAARYFNGSPEHQTLKNVIVTEAHASKGAKQAEYRSTRSEYDRLNTLYMNARCEYRTITIDAFCDPPETRDEHKYDCQKCSYARMRDALDIKIHEWPLPTDNTKSAAVVFELKVPTWYAAWRDARAFLLQQVLQGSRAPSRLQASYALSSNDPHLSRKFNGATTRRIGLLSEQKPVVQSHYAHKKITEVDVNTVCHLNGLKYEYYDSTASCYLVPFKFDYQVQTSCTYALPTSSLQHYIFRPADCPDGKPPNLVIAAQDRCPGHMSLDEYRELATIPLGRHLQWVNILQQLAMPGVDFKKLETTLTFLQCIYQTGPPAGEVLRESHVFFKDNSRAIDVLINLDLAVERIKKNWESTQALSVFASIATRVLALNSSTQQVCLPLLAKMRGIAMEWIQKVQEKAHKATDDDDRIMFIATSVEIAFICGSTFDVETKHLSTILESVDDCSTLIKASIVAQHGENTQKSAADHICMLRLRFTRVLHRCYKLLAAQHKALDDAVKQSWSAYTPGHSGWSAVSPSIKDWVTTDTDLSSGHSMQVHYNILSGELLVNGTPLDQPPQSYRILDLYQTLFGQSVVEVMPSSTPGFQFSTKRTYEGYAVLMGLHAHTDVENDLVVRGIRGTETIETLPRRLFGSSFPEEFIEDYLHWYNFTSGHVEFRPIKDAWNATSTAIWTLQKTHDSVWQLVKVSNALVGLQSPTAKVISNVLNPLADPGQIHCIAQHGGASLVVELPGINLSFSLSRGASLLKSKEYPSMSVDGDQALGTLIGFSNKLMLISDTGDRLLLLPESDVTYMQQQIHLTVRVFRLKSIKKVHALRVDMQLGRLVDQGDLDCKFYMAYLHALTSGCLPDPLTRMTGTEQALAILNSCAVRSFSQLSQANVDMLSMIARLSPGRRYYPSNKRVMQTITWDTQLSYLSQYARLRILVESIFHQAEKAKVFHPEVKLEFPNLQQCEADLQQRDSMRSSIFRVAGFGAEDHTLLHDRLYTPRDRGVGNQRAINAATISGLILRNDEDKHSDLPSLDWSLECMWKKLVKCSTIHGPSTGTGNARHRYDRACMDKDYFQEVLSRLPSHLRELNQVQQQQDRHSTAIWLSSMAFAEHADLEIIQLLAMSSKSSHMKAIRAPSDTAFHMVDGIHRHESEVRDIVNQSVRSFEVSPESRTPRHRNEKFARYEARCRRLWQTAHTTAVKKVVSAFVGQFPASTPAPLNVEGASVYIDIVRATGFVRSLFQSWHANNLLHDYVESVLQSLASLNTTSVWLPTLSNVTASVRPSIVGYLTVADLFTGLAPHIAKSHGVLQQPIDKGASNRLDEPDSSRLSTLIDRLAHSAGSSGYELSYVNDLRMSLNAYIEQGRNKSRNAPFSSDFLFDYQMMCMRHVRDVYDKLFEAIKSLENSYAEQMAQHWPRISPSLLLQQLSHDHIAKLPQSWRVSIVNYGLAITALQQADRLVAFAKSAQHQELYNELCNVGHTNWNPHDYPDSLLMEVESGIMIREVQEQIASEMRAPPCGRNAVMQLNMGEGKSTVIIPMVAAALADSKQLVRVIVAKPQSKQMAQMMIAKFGGLVGRRIFYMPFSRTIALTSSVARAIDDTLRECMVTGGILLVQPEHLLSFKLMALECFISSKEDLGQALVETQDFFDNHSRDIVDESDENFSIRFELIYTMGMQQTIELAPDRWFFI